MVIQIIARKTALRTYDASSSANNNRHAPTGSCAAAMAMVAIWLRSPHSARKVSVKACARKQKYHKQLGGTRDGACQSRCLKGNQTPSIAKGPGLIKTTATAPEVNLTCVRMAQSFLQ